MTPSPVVRALPDVNFKSLDLAGGKAASLGEMLAAGLPVPPGFVVTTAAFRAGLTETVKQQITAAFRALGAGRVAVRSSAVAEDSGAASWAGQLDTILNVTEGDLLGAVEQCWQSINSAHAQGYAARHHIPASAQAVALVVQADNQKPNRAND
jgi:phosphoenolpyruvate synthase/pyruvate phosphate dikinase